MDKELFTHRLCTDLVLVDAFVHDIKMKRKALDDDQKKFDLFLNRLAKYIPFQKGDFITNGTQMLLFDSIQSVIYSSYMRNKESVRFILNVRHWIYDNGHRWATNITTIDVYIDKLKDWTLHRNSPLSTLQEFVNIQP